jgi:class 3 adenylate cyclase
MPMDIATWLRRLGLDQYESAFRGNDIDGEVLPELTAEDLISLGVTSVGHRRRLLGAIAQLKAESLTPHRASDASPPGPTLSSGHPEAAERRQLTVMFCDLVGSTALAARLDPEDLREVIGGYQRAVAETVRRFDGFVAKFMGDGVLVYFGYPQAREDDAERAVLAGLDLVASVAAPPPSAGAALACRVGIATGLVVVGDLLGTGSAQEQAVVGETPNLAARLQALATPNSVIIDRTARRQIGELFDVENLGPQRLAGFAEPQHAWRVVGESGVVSRFEALRSEGAPLVGRDEDLDLLLRLWQQAKAGEGRIVLLSGEAGIGKSRLVAALSLRIHGEPHSRLRYSCSPQHPDSALHPVILQLERAAGFAREDGAERRLEKLRALLGPSARREEEIALLAEMLSLPAAAPAPNSSPQRKREMLFEALLHQLEALAESRPVLMIFEDVHWIDPTSRELLDLILDLAPRLPLMLVVTLRPEFEHGWAGQPRVVTLSLSRLTGRDSRVLA